MSLSGLDDPSCEPGTDELESLLGPSVELWRRLVTAVAERHEPVSGVWNFGGAKHGWVLRLKRKDRIIVYLIPQAGGFLVGVVLGERAYESTREMPLPEQVRELMEQAPRYAEGRGFRVPVRSEADVDAVIALAAAKMAR